MDTVREDCRQGGGHHDGGSSFADVDANNPGEQAEGSRPMILQLRSCPIADRRTSVLAAVQEKPPLTVPSLFAARSRSPRRNAGLLGFRHSPGNL